MTTETDGIMKVLFTSSSANNTMVYVSSSPMTETFQRPNFSSLEESGNIHNQ